MNLGKLLGAGKSFFGGRGNVAYRENKNVYLPKFNSDKNPFAGKKESSEETAKPAATAKVSRLVSASSGPAPAQTSARPTRALAWTDRLNPFRPSEPVAPLMVNAVQTELSLDAVKVIHNDLSDADIEVVPVKSNTGAGAEVPVLPPARRSWEFMGERLASAR